MILAQNQVQSAIQFEVEHFWIYGQKVRPKKIKLREKLLTFHEDYFYSFAQWPWPLSKIFEPLSRWLERKNRTRLDLYGAPQFATTFTLKDVGQNARTAVSDYDNWFAESNWKKWFQATTTQQTPTIVVTETAIKGGYLGDSQPDLALVSAAKWEDFFLPDSGLEYVLNSIQRFSLRMLYASKLRTHYPSRGCLWDFHVHQPDSRISSHLGFLCETCQQLLKTDTSPAEYEELMTLLSNKWIGSETETSSVAGILRKSYKYSLSRSSGLHQDTFAGVSDAMKSEFGKLLIEVIKWSLIVIITLLLLTYFPEATKKWKEFFNGPKDANASITISPSPSPVANTSETNANLPNDSNPQ